MGSWTIFQMEEASPSCIEHVHQVMETNPGFDIVCDKGAYVLDVDVNDGGQQPENNSGIAFPVIRTEHWERGLSQSQHSLERKRATHQDIHGENQNTFEQVNVKVPPTNYEPTKEERQSHEATHCPFRSWCEVCVKAKSPDGRFTKQLADTEHILVIEFDYAFATGTPGDPNRKISMMIAIDSIHGSIFDVVVGREGGQYDYVIRSFHNNIDRLGLVTSELKCDQEPSTLDVANALVRRCQSTNLVVIATPKRTEREPGAWRTSKFDNSGTAAGLFWEGVLLKYRTEIRPEHVLMS